jgi:single-strand DNA-binding protein
MASYNRVILVGNLTRDVELRYIPSGTAVTDVGLAVSEKYKKNEQWVEETSFFDVTIWGRTAEIAAEYLSKGSNVLIEGKLKQDRWEQDGQKRSKVKVTCDRMQMLGSKPGSGGEGGNYQSNSNQSSPSQSSPSQSDHQSSSHESEPEPQSVPEDDVPF